MIVNEKNRVCPAEHAGALDIGVIRLFHNLIIDLLEDFRYITSYEWSYIDEKKFRFAFCPFVDFMLKILDRTD